MKSNNNDLTKKALIIAGLTLLLVIFLVLLLAFYAGDSSGFEKKVAVIPLKGEISMSYGGYSEGFSALELVEKLDEAQNDPSIGVIFLDIDSPGGSVVATKQIVYKVLEVKKTKPVVSYIGEVGASGAYYVAASSDYIITDADSITGSIGVISIVPNIEELLTKIGVKVNIVKAGEYKAIGSIFEELKPQERELLETLIMETFEGFKSDVLSFRKDKLNKIQFEKVADGRIISGRQALSLKLVDELLPREKAIEKAAQIGGISGEPSIKNYQKPAPTLFDLFSISGQAFGFGLNKGISSQANQSIEVRA